MLALGMLPDDADRFNGETLEEVSLPNALVLGTITKNYSRAVRGAGYVVDTTVTIGYDTPWRQVEAMLIEAARRTPDLGDPAAAKVVAKGDWYASPALAPEAPGG